VKHKFSFPSPKKILPGKFRTTLIAGVAGLVNSVFLVFIALKDKPESEKLNNHKRPTAVT